MNSLLESLASGSTQRQQDLAILGHELRNPLAAVVTGVATAAAMTAADDPRAGLLQRAVRDLDRLTQLLNAYLELAGGRLRRVHDVDFAAVVRAVAARRGSAAVSVELRGDLRVFGSAALLERAVENLLDNAFAAGAKRVDVSALREGDQVVVRVHDDGPGVAPALRPSLFVPFVSGRGGTGLGLSVVADIALAHGGKVRLLPAAGGARFELTLPGLVDGGERRLRAGVGACAS